MQPKLEGFKIMTFLDFLYQHGINLRFDFSFVTWDFISNYLLKGFYFSISMTVVATLIGVTFGTLLALARLSSFTPISMLATFYITVMRSIPLVLVILWFFLIIPAIIGTHIDVYWSALITFSAFEAAYFAEIMRAGIQSISRGQFQAGEALGMTYWQRMKIIIVPQAFRNMLPVLLTQVIILFQDTSLVYAIGGYDLLKGFSLAGQIYNRQTESYILAALTYFIICFTLSLCVKQFQKRLAIIR